MKKTCKKSTYVFIVLVVMTFLLLCMQSVPVQALDAVPLYERVSISSMIRDLYPAAGISSAVALNESGDAVGYTLIGSTYHAFIYTEAHGVHLLPVLGETPNHIAVDVTDRDTNGQVLIAGTAMIGVTDHNSDAGRAVLWVYDTLAGQTVETVDVGVLTGFDLSRIDAVNTNGLAAGFSRVDAFLGPLQPMVYDYTTGILQAVDLPFRPVDMNDSNQVVGNNIRATLSKDPATGIITVTGLEDLGAPAGTGPGSITAINELGWVSGVTGMGYGDGAGRIVAGATLYSDIWSVLWAHSAFDRASGLNSFGDVVGILGISSAMRAALHIEALNEVFLIEDLQDPPAFLDSARDINDAGWISGGSAGAVLLVRIGDMPPPDPPFNLTAVPHEPTWQQPWNAITLNWENTSTLTRSYSVERSIAGADSWTEIKTGWINTQLWDMGIDLGVTYDYRVRAEGIAGFSDYSNTATATAPGEPVDTTAPVGTIMAPAEGAEVSGNVQISIEASDDRALDYVDVRYAPSMGNTVICTEPLNGAQNATMSCTWRTRKIDPGDYTITATTVDTMGNYSRDSIAITLIKEQKGGGKGRGGGKNR